MVNSTEYTRLTICLALPRSGTAWMCKLLEPVAVTLHDGVGRFLGDVDELGVWVDMTRGTQDRPIFISDTSGGIYFKKLRKRFPGCKFVVVLRNPVEVSWALGKAGFTIDGQPAIDLGRLKGMHRSLLWANDAASWVDVWKPRWDTTFAAALHALVTGTVPQRRVLEAACRQHVEIPREEQMRRLELALRGSNGR